MIRRLGFAILIVWCARAPAYVMHMPANTDPRFRIGRFLGGIAQTALSNLFAVPEDQFVNCARVFALDDGTKLAGLYFPGPRPNAEPLVIINFGLVADDRANPVRDFINSIIKPNLIHSSFLIIGSATSAQFLLMNGEISIGGYDEGRMMIQLVNALAKHGISYSSLHLMGVSLGGNAVLQALIEDARLGGGRFSSAVIFSGVINEEESTQTVFSTYGAPLKGLPSGDPLSTGGRIILDAAVDHFNDILRFKGEDTVPPPWENLGQYFYNEFETRREDLTMNPVSMASWNPTISLLSVEDYVRTSSAIVMNNLDKIRVPVIVVHAENDPIIPYKQFERLQTAEIKNADVGTLGTPVGGHWGFLYMYGPKWVEHILNRSVRWATKQTN